MGLNVDHYGPLRLIAASPADYPVVGFPGDPGTMTAADYPASSIYNLVEPLLAYGQVTAFPLGMPLGVLLALYYSKYITLQGSAETSSSDPSGTPPVSTTYATATFAEQNDYTANATTGDDIDLATSILQQRGTGVGDSAVIVTRTQASGIISVFDAGAGAISEATATAGDDPPSTTAELVTASVRIFSAGPSSSVAAPYVLKDAVTGLYFPPLAISFGGENAFGVDGVVATVNYAVPANPAAAAGSFAAGTATLKVGPWQGTMPLYATVPAAQGDFSNSGAFSLVVTAYADMGP